MTKIKFMEARMKLEAWLARHVITIMLFGIVVFSDFWSDKLEVVAEAIEDFCRGPLDMRSGTAGAVTEVLLIYSIVCLVNWLVRFTISRTKRLFTKKPTEKKTERSA